MDETEFISKLLIKTFEGLYKDNTEFNTVIKHFSIMIFNFWNSFWFNNNIILYSNRIKICQRIGEN